MECSMKKLALTLSLFIGVLMINFEARTQSGCSCWSSMLSYLPYYCAHCYEFPADEYDNDFFQLLFDLNDQQSTPYKGGDIELHKLARAHSKAMCDSDRQYHQDLTAALDKYNNIIADIKFNGDNQLATEIRENIFYAPNLDTHAAFNGFKNSPSHYATMISNTNRVGISHVKCANGKDAWTIIFTKVMYY